MKKLLSKLGGSGSKNGQGGDSKVSSVTASPPEAAKKPAAKPLVPPPVADDECIPGAWKIGLGAQKEATTVKVRGMNESDECAASPMLIHPPLQVNRGAIRWTHSKQETIHLELKTTNWLSHGSVYFCLHNEAPSSTNAFLIVESRSDKTEYSYYKYALAGVAEMAS